MRIVSGKHKGRPILAPKGRGTRPTGDRARESVFNILAHAAWAPHLEGAAVLDVFAGSGALGLEALSRGAAHCLFVETDAKARGAIRDNIEAMGLFGVTTLHKRSAVSLGDMPQGRTGPYDLVFLDPPYNKGLVAPALASLIDGGWLASNAVAMVETAADETLDAPGWHLLDERTIGAAKISFIAHD